MSSGNNNDRLSYSTGASSTSQTDLGVVVGHLETLMATRQGQVNKAMADFNADGVSADYQSVERRWNNAAGEVRSIIALVKSTLGLNDQSATHAQTKAANAVHGIG